MIFAKHGLIFKSEDINQHMKKFEWYKPSINFDESLLSENERNNLEYILKFENGVSPSKIDISDLQGIWQKDLPIAASGWARRIEISNDKFVFYYSQMNYLKRIYSFSGVIEIKNNNLYLIVNKETVFLDGKLGDEFTGAFGYVLEDYNTVEREIEPTITMSFPISNIKLFRNEEYDIEREYLELGGFEYFRW